MKARDLAALAALGVAGYAAYNKFGKKKDEPKKKMGEGLEMSNQGAYERATIPKSEEVVNEKRSRQENDVPEALSRQERDVPDRIMGRDAAGSRFTDRDVPEVVEKFTPRDKEGLIKKNISARPSAAGANSKTPKAALKASTANDNADAASKSLSSTGGPSRYRREAGASTAEDAVADYSNEGRSSKAPVTLARLNEANGAASESARITDALAVGSRANQAAYLEGKRNDQMAAAGSPSARATDALAVGSRANQAAYLKDKQAPDYSNEGRNRAPVTALSRINETGGATSPSARATDALAVGSRANQAAYKKAQLETQAANAQAQARMMRQGSPMAASRRNAGMPGYDEAGNPISMRSMAGQRGFDEAGNKMKRGGMVKKMASGGMTSSKPSTASSRGDGIAQRGKTRGKLC